VGSGLDGLEKRVDGENDGLCAQFIHDEDAFGWVVEPVPTIFPAGQSMIS
jgi:hypothetical protein